MAKGKYAAWIRPERLAQIEQWAAELTDAELAAAMRISSSTLYAWMQKHAEIAEAVSRGRAGTHAREINEQVEGALLKKSLGYTVQVRKLFKLREVIYDETSGRRIRETEKLEEGLEDIHVPADTGAQKFWLTNRMPERWKNKTEATLSGGAGAVKVEFEGESGDYAD